MTNGARYSPAKPSRLIQGAPRFPLWGCSTCGASDNWGDRSGCRRCHAVAPPHILRRQREAHRGPRSDGGGNAGGSGGQRQQQSNFVMGWGGSGGGKGSGGGSWGKGASAARQTVAAGRAAPESAAAPSRAGGAAAELAELRRANDRLVRQLEEARAKSGTQACDEEDDGEDDAGEHQEEAAREDRIRLIQANIRAVAALYGEESPEHLAKKEELDSLLKAKREGRPLRTQLQAADRRIDRQKGKVNKLESLAADARSRIDELQAELGKLESDLADARTQLGTMEEERKTILLREAQAQSDQPTAEAAAAPAAEGETEWRRVCEIIKCRATQPQVHPELSQQIGTALDLLRTLCGQLPVPATTAAEPGVPAAMAAATRPQHQPQPPRGGERIDDGDDTKKWSKVVSAKVRKGVARVARIRASMDGHATATGTMATTTPAPATTPAALAVGTPPPPAGGAATTEPTDSTSATAAGSTMETWVAQASASELAKHFNNSDFEEMEDVAESSDGTDEEAVLADAALAGATAEQQGRVKAILERRRIRTAQRRSGPKRLKKAGKLREPISGEASDRKKATGRK